MSIREGDLLDGRFRIASLLGRGGMGEVWSATRVEGEQRVAIKVLLDAAARKPDLVARFEREARIAGAVKSPYVCELLDAGKTRAGEPYLVFQLMRGESLAERLKRDGDMGCAELLPLLDNALEGLIAAHGVGVVHRDLKPANIFLEQRGAGALQATLLDFGISKLLPHGKSRDERSLTAFDATLGSFAYMAPEQVRGAARADERADVYAVGAVAFRCLAGRLPFEGANAAMLLSAKLNDDPPTLTETTGERWPARVERFLATALARQREERFATAALMLEAWREVGQSFGRALTAGDALASGPEGEEP